MICLSATHPGIRTRSTKYTFDNALLQLIYSTKGPIVVNVGDFADYPNKSYVPWSRLSRFFGDGRPPTFNRESL